MSERLKSTLTFLTSIVILGSIWEVASRREMINSLVLPAPSEIGSALWFVTRNFFGPVAYWRDTWITLQEIIAGYIIGVSAAVILGSLVAEFRVVRRTVIPYTVALNATPKIALAPLFVIFFGFGLTPKVLMAAFICFFPVLINTVSGLASADGDQLKLMASLRASRWETFRRLRVMQALPFVFAGMRTAMAFAVVGAIVGEFFGASRGLGFRIEFAAARLETANLFAFLVILSLVAYALYTLIERIEKRVVFWTGFLQSNIKP